MSDRIDFKVLRYDRKKDQRPYWQTYRVERVPGMTVLSALLEIQTKQDGSLAFRYACRAGVCGSCAMHINGKYRLACETQVKELGRTVKLRPLGHLEVIKDLMVDLSPFWDKYRTVKPYLIAGDSPPERERHQSADDRTKLDVLTDCILCAACHAACTLTALDSDYLGPAVLTKIDRFVSDTRDGHTEQRLEMASGEHGVWRCHTIFNCQKVCPKDIDPAGAIGHLKRLHTIARFKRR